MLRCTARFLRYVVLVQYSTLNKMATLTPHQFRPCVPIYKGGDEPMGHITVNVLKSQTLNSILFWLQFCFYAVFYFLKMFSGLPNSVDSDQTAPQGAVWSGSSLSEYGILSDTWVLGHFRNLIITLRFKLVHGETWLIRLRVNSATRLTSIDTYAISEKKKKKKIILWKKVLEQSALFPKIISTFWQDNFWDHKSFLLLSVNMSTHVSLY